MTNNPCLKRRLLTGLAVFFSLIIFSSPVQAETDCPFGVENDPAPGQCGLYIDNNGDYICDHSETEIEGKAEFKDPGVKKDYLSEDELKQLSVGEVANFFSISPSQYANELGRFLNKKVNASDSLQVLHDEFNLCSNVAASIAQELQNNYGSSQIIDSLTDDEFDVHDLINGQELKTRTVAEVADIYGIDSGDYANELSLYLGTSVKERDSFQVLHDNFDLAPSIAKDIAEKLLAGEEIANLPASLENELPSQTESRYKFVLIMISLIVLYIISFLMVKSKYISLLTHHRIWNVLLLITFLATAVMGVMLIFAINFGWFLSLYSFLLYWHVELGSAMVIITMFHLSWHWQYYTAIFKKMPKVEDSNSK